MMSSESRQLVAHAQRTLAEHGRTFAWASVWLGDRQGESIALLYAFCRRVDDLVDEKPVDEARLALAGVRRDVASGASADPVIESFLRISREHGIDSRVVDELLTGFETDLDGVRVANESELVRYAYRVAGTVGLMCTRLFGVQDAKAEPFAVDLGIAMQLTNIARDVREDAERDRIYLPGRWLTPRVDPASLRAPSPPVMREVRSATDRLLALAGRYYRSADHGMRALPPRARIAVWVASRVYEAIGPRVRARPSSAWGERAVVDTKRKLLHSLRAAGSFLASSVVPGRALRAHDPDLHRPLRGLPGCDPRA